MNMIFRPITGAQTKSAGSGWSRGAGGCRFRAGRYARPVTEQWSINTAIMNPMAEEPVSRATNLMSALPQRNDWVNRAGAPSWYIAGEQSDNQQQTSNCG